MTIRPLEIPSPIIPRTPLFKSQRPFIHLVCLRVDLPSDVAGKIADYLIGNENPFGAKEWKKYYGVDVGPEPALPKDFYKFWNGPDPIDPTKGVWETHLPPVLRPECVTVPSKNTRLPYNLGMLGLLIQQPKNGHPTKYRSNTEALHQNENIKAGPTCWLVVRKGVFDETRNQFAFEQTLFINRLNMRTHADYQERVSELDLSTVLCARHVFTGERHLGDNTGMENRLTFSSCPGSDRNMLVGNFGPDGLAVDCIAFGNHNNTTGRTGLRKFFSDAKKLERRMVVIASLIAGIALTVICRVGVVPLFGLSTILGATSLLLYGLFTYDVSYLLTRILVEYQNSYKDFRTIVSEVNEDTFQYTLFLKYIYRSIRIINNAFLARA